MSSPLPEALLDEDGELEGPARAPVARRWWVIGGLGCALMLALATWFALSATVDRVRWQTAHFTAVDDSQVEVTYTIRRPEAMAVRCTLKALSSDFGAVGLVDVTIPANEGPEVTRTDRVRTIEAATTAVVDTCRPL